MDVTGADLGLQGLRHKVSWMLLTAGLRGLVRKLPGDSTTGDGDGDESYVDSHMMNPFLLQLDLFPERGA